MFKEDEILYYQQGFQTELVKLICFGERFSCVETTVLQSNFKKIVETKCLHPLNKVEPVKTIRIGNYDVPEPLREAPAVGTKYYIPYIQCFNLIGEQVWQGGWFKHDYLFLKQGLIHLTKEAAELHAKALLAFTTTEVAR